MFTAALRRSGGSLIVTIPQAYVEQNHPGFLISMTGLGLKIDGCFHAHQLKTLDWTTRKAQRRRGEVRPPKPETRIEKQQNMTLAQIIADLPKTCDIGSKRDSQGFKYSWRGYKLHIDTADDDIPVNAILTSAFRA